MNQGKYVSFASETNSLEVFVFGGVNSLKKN